MKTFLSFSALVAASSLACATDSPFSSGMVLGIHGGGIHHKTKYRDVYDFSAVNAGIIPSKIDTSSTNIFWGLNGGYRHRLGHHVTLAAMMSVDFFASRPTSVESGDRTFAPTKVEYWRSHTITPEVILGYAWDQESEKWHTGIGLGMPITRFDVELQNLVSAKPQVFQEHKTLKGFRTTLHVDYGITQHLFVNVGAGYEWYPDVKVTLGQEFTPDVNGTQYQTKAKFSGFKGRVGLSYRF